jgi:cytochrome d ubiquinol oxidase subunit I
MWVFVFAVLGAVAANQMGWVAAEVGRQPWVVHPPLARDADGTPALDRDGFVRYRTTEITLADGARQEMIAGLRTDEAVSEVVTSNQVLGSILLFGAIYLLLLFLWIFVLNRKIQQGPDRPSAEGRQEGLLDVASTLSGHSGSMTGEN